MRDFIIDQIRETLEQDVFPRLSKAKARVALALLVLGADASQAEVAEWVGLLLFKSLLERAGASISLCYFR